MNERCRAVPDDARPASTAESRRRLMIALIVAGCAMVLALLVVVSPARADVTSINPTNGSSITPTLGTSLDLVVTATETGTQPDLCRTSATFISVSVTGSGAVIRPSADYNGSGTFASSFVICGGTTASKTFVLDIVGLSPATIAIQVSNFEGGDAPLQSFTLAPVPAPAVPDAFTTTEDTALTVPASGVLANDTGYVSAVPATGPTANGLGTVALVADGSLTFTPAPDANGSDTFVYTAVSGEVRSDATITFTVTAIDDPPSFVDASVPSPVSVTATSPAGATVVFTSPRATDPDGTEPTVSCSPASGSIFRIGTTTVTCTASDGNGGTDTASFTVRVTAMASQGRIRWIGGPQPGGIYTVANVPAAPTCEGIDFAVPVIQCRVYGYQSGPGFWTMTARARDAEGNSAVETRTYRVVSGGPVPGTTPNPQPTPPGQPTATPRPTSVPATVTPTRPVRPATAPVQPTPTPATPGRPPRP